MATHEPASIRDIGAALGRGRSTVQRAVAGLVADRRVVVERRGTGKDYPTRYRTPDRSGDA